MNEIVIMDFSKQYKDLYNHAFDMFCKVHLMQMGDISGTNGYCDDTAANTIRTRISEFSYEGIRFIDSGNYHYLSLFWMEKVKEDFALVLFDHHSDTQEAAFGDILSCGSWVKRATETNRHLKKVYSIGVEGVSEEEIQGDLPIYISIDKDVMEEEYAACDWDQGQMTLIELMNRLQDLFKDHRILGIDICGDKKTPNDNELEINNKTNKSLLALIRNSFDS